MADFFDVGFVEFCAAVSGSVLVGFAMAIGVQMVFAHSDVFKIFGMIVGFSTVSVIDLMARRARSEKRVSDETVNRAEVIAAMEGDTRIAVLV